MPVIDAVASDYQGQISFLAVAGKSTPEASADRVGVWFSPDRLLWGYSDDMWALFGVPGQPVSVLITSDGFEVGRWFGEASEADLRAALDQLITYG
ncbi:MAG: hypothetical protein MUP76_02335 [Acidimicrobiia bacterium]|nr:hypothetical protein [Acidimicrobiia bacterium]